MDVKRMPESVSHAVRELLRPYCGSLAPGEIEEALNRREDGRAESGASRQRLLTLPEVAEQLQVSIRTVWNLINSGELRTIRVGKRNVRVSVAEVERLTSIEEDGNHE